MLEKIEFFDGAIKFSSLLLIFDILIIIHFLYCCASKSKWKISPWNIGIFFNFFIPFMIMYPFSGSILNYDCIEIISEKSIDTAFCIYLVGYISFWTGRLIFDNVKIKSVNYHPRVISWFFSKIISNISSSSVLIFLSSLSFLSTVFVLIIQIKNGRFFNIRDYFLENNDFRFIYNFSLSLYGMTINYIGLNLIQKKTKGLFILFLCMISCTVLYGTRGLIIGSVVTYLLNKIYFEKGNFSFLRIGAFGIILMFVAINIDDLRHGYFQPLNALKLFFFKVFYGNNFSDLRDFAWMLSHWDEKLLLGKSYVASLVSFIPRSFSEFRNEWGFSYYITDMVGLSQSSHAGLRPGLFGQVYFNFSYIGVIFSGLIGGYTLRYSDVKLREMVEKEKNIIKGIVYGIPYMLVTEFLFGWVFWSFYFFIIMNLILIFISKIKIRTYSYPT